MPTESQDAAGQELPGRGIFTTVDPATLVIGLNTRSDPALTAHFVADIRDRGVRQPITVRRRAGDGALVVREGARRTLAAVRAGLTEVEVIIRPGDADARDDDPDAHAAAEVDRIIDQLGENGHRAPISDADEVRSAQQLLDLGVSAAQIARRTHFPASRVRSTTAVARSPHATAALVEHVQLPLDHAVAMAEFDNDPDALDRLTSAIAHPGLFAHEVQRLRDERRRRDLHARAVAELAAQHIPVIDDDADTRWERLVHLRRSQDAEPGTAIDPEEHRTCPGHAAVVRIVRRWPDAITAQTDWVCADVARHGHAPRTEGSVLRSDASTRSGAMTDEQKAERRRVIANNKAWDSAQAVRREWLTTFLAGKPPADAAVFIAVSLGHGHHCLGRALTDRHRLACELLSLDSPLGTRVGGTPHPIARAAAAVTGPRAIMLSLAVVLAAFEGATSRFTWRSPDTADQTYFRCLADWGYQLSEVEQLVLADPEQSRSEQGRPEDGGSDREIPSSGGVPGEATATTAPPQGDGPRLRTTAPDAA